MRDPDKQDIRRAADIFKVLSNPGRLRIACSLIDGHETTQKEIIDQLGWPQSTVNRHLQGLREVGLVGSRREGNKVLLELDGVVTQNLLHAVCEWVHPETGETMTTDLGEPIASNAGRAEVSTTGGKGR